MNNVSVVIPCTDRVLGLKKCLMSVLNQNFSGDLDVILIENNSRDRNRVSDLVSSIDDKRIRHFYMTDCDNANCARNYGVRLSQGDYIAFLDSDDWWDSNHIAACLELVESGSKAIYSGFRLYNGFNTKEVLSRSFKEKETAYDFLFSSNASVAQTSSFFIEKSLFESCEWDEMLRRNQDYDFFIKLNDVAEWSWKRDFTVNVYWPAGEARTYSRDAFTRFLDKHKKSMTQLNLSFYLFEIMRALSYTKKEDFDFFLSDVATCRGYLDPIKRIQTYNYYLTKFICLIRHQLRKFIKG